jgi:glycosyltransferase involved in cell wall biosynthesis
LGHYPKSNLFGGVARVVYNLSYELSKENCEPVIFKKKRYKYFFKKDTCEKDKNLTVCSTTHLGLVISLIKNRYNIINVHNLSSFFIIPVILKKLRIIDSKVVFVSHGLVPIEKENKRYNYPWRYFLYQKLCFQWSDHIIAVSNYLKSSIMKKYDINGNKISIVHNGVEEIFFAEAKTSFAGTSQYILFVGEITQMKGLDFLLSALQQLDNYHLILIGKETVYLKELKKKYFTLFESGKVTYYGETDAKELSLAYSNAKFLVLLSIYDSYAMVVLEAMAAGKPVVISENVGSKEIIENGKEGFIVPLGDTDSLVSALKYLLNDEKEVKKMGQLAKQKALKNTWSIKSKEYLKIFEHVNDEKVF